MGKKILVMRYLEKVEGHINLWSRTIYQANGVVVALQATLASNMAKSFGDITPHTHEFDELIYRIANDYGDHNRDNIPAYGIDGCVLRIPQATEHGGMAYGTWLSIKPEEYSFNEVYLNGNNVALEYDGEKRIQAIFGTNAGQVDTTTIDLLVVPGLGGVNVFEPQKAAVRDKLKEKRYVALRLG